MTASCFRQGHPIQASKPVSAQRIGTLCRVPGKAGLPGEICFPLRQKMCIRDSYKTSKNGVDWEPGIGTLIPEQWGGPYLEQLEDGRLLVSSNAGVISVGNEEGAQWKTLEPPAFPSFTWSSLKALEGNRFAVFNSCSREEGGHNIQLRFGELEK